MVININSSSRLGTKPKEVSHAKGKDTTESKNKQGNYGFILKEIIQSLISRPRLRAEHNDQKLLGQLMSAGSSNLSPGDKFGQLSMRKFVQELLEKEVQEYLGRAYYEHGETQKGYRNGYKSEFGSIGPAHLKTAEDRLLVQKPQVADSSETFSSQLWSHIKGRTEQLERIAVEMYARGCSTRDIEELLKDKEGHILLSKSAVSQLGSRLWEEYETFCQMDLSQHDVIYLFSDAAYESLRLHKSRKEGVLVVWGILSNGSKVLLNMRRGNKESYEDWLEVFRDLKKRGLGEIPSWVPQMAHPVSYKLLRKSSPRP